MKNQQPNKSEMAGELANPVIGTWQYIMEENVNNQKLITNKYRQEIIDGLLKLHDHSDAVEVIKTLSPDPKNEIKERFKLTSMQAAAIMDLKKPLSSISKEKILEEKENLKSIEIQLTQDMPDIIELGTIIVSREMEFIFDDGRKEKAYLKVGMPFECKENTDWCCPYELSTESKKKVFGMVGIDALQALEFTMKILRVEIEHWERTKNGKFYFLNEEGAGI